MVNAEVNKQLRELYEDRYARRFTSFTVSIPAILSILAVVQNQSILFLFAIYFFIAAFIFVDSVYIFFAYKPSDFSSNRYIPKYPVLRPYARAGLAISVLMSVAGFLIPQSPASFQRAIQEWATLTPTATIIDTATTTVTPTETTTPTATFTPTMTATATYIPTATSSVTPIPTSTDIPSPTPDPKQFRGFDKNCIDQKYWILGSNQGNPPTYKQNAKICYDLSAKGLNSQNEGLRFNGSPLYSPIFGMHTKLPSRTDVDIQFKLRIDTFTASTNSIDSVLILGVSDLKDWNFKDGEYLFHGIRPAYRSTNIIREVGPSKTQADVRWTPDVQPGNIYDIQFSIRGIDLYIYVDGKTLNYYPRSLSRFNEEKVFWIGYQLPVNNSNLRASITEFSIVEK